MRFLCPAAFAALATWPVQAAAEPLAGPSGPGVDAAWNSAFIQVGAASSGVPTFRQREQDRAWVRAGGSWTPHPAVELRASVDGAGARWGPDEHAIGPGDIRLATSARAWDRRGPEVWLDWHVKLPNADEATGLGTDETDTRGMVLVRWSEARWHAQVGAGLEILGDPWQTSAQEDRMAVQGDAAWRFGATWVRVGVDAGLLAPHEPAQARARVRLDQPLGPIDVGAEVRVGLTPAAYDLGGALTVRLVPARTRP